MNTDTDKALIAKINRRLAKDGQALRTARGENPDSNLGLHYIVDVDHNTVAATHCDLQTLATELGIAQVSP
ncbi:hypothetical protein [Thermomonas carbonis]|uniref:Uncharacterized protein n=1 Tax=Thermomonas carbonis TaxID=1463158 RepID=A0A7G9SR93_9GAMM|nr:hypothetical protein [Thermomonas carbonis]QNN70368.1 hypothetical protein H9L16_01640 [Thermomonas carbonis]GHB99558.1 hypothetical protein GCM10010080_10510 [Thermomonas carbonis]